MRIAHRRFTDQPLSKVEVIAYLLGYGMEFTANEQWIFLNVSSLEATLFDALHPKLASGYLLTTKLLRAHALRTRPPSRWRSNFSADVTFGPLASSAPLLSHERTRRNRQGHVREPPLVLFTCRLFDLFCVRLPRLGGPLRSCGYG